MGLSKRLQLISNKTVVDHFAVFCNFRYLYAHPRQGQGKSGNELCEVANDKWDKSKLMMCLTKGEGREEFVASIEEVMKSFNEEADREKYLEDRTPDRYMTKLSEVMIKEGIKHLGARAKGEDCNVDRKERMRLLKLRRDARQKLGECEVRGQVEGGYSEMWQAKEEVEDRKAVLVARRDVGGLKGRQLAEVQRLVTALCISKFGPKKRFFRTLVGSQPTEMEWLEAWGKDGASGGMQVSCGASKDIKALGKYLVKCLRRRARPEFSPPAELLLLLLRPNLRKDAAKLGVGAENKKIKNPDFWRALRRGHYHINQAGFAPLKWHRSKGGALRKRGGTERERVVHILHVQGKAFYSGKMKARQVKATSDFDHGFTKSR